MATQSLGEDLAVEVRALRLGGPGARSRAVAVLSPAARIGRSAAPPPAIAVSRAEMNHAIDETMKQTALRLAPAASNGERLAQP